jgi:hypothetical protein
MSERSASCHGRGGRPSCERRALTEPRTGLGQEHHERVYQAGSCSANAATSYSRSAAVSTLSGVTAAAAAVLLAACAVPRSEQIRGTHDTRGKPRTLGHVVPRDNAGAPRRQTIGVERGGDGAPTASVVAVRVEIASVPPRRRCGFREKTSQLIRPPNRGNVSGACPGRRSRRGSAREALTRPAERGSLEGRGPTA